MNWAPVLLLIGITCTVAACERSRHDMYDQPKFKPLTPTTLFDDGSSSRPQVEGTVARSGGALAGSSSGRIGRAEATAATQPDPPPVSAALLARGRERFDIYCSPCHSATGDGNGMIARRGFPQPPSYHTDRLRNAPDSHFYQVIADGYGVMYPYADRVSPHDRWAIIAYIRALQLSQHTPASMLRPDDLSKLSGGAP